MSVHLHSHVTIDVNVTCERTVQSLHSYTRLDRIQTSQVFIVPVLLVWADTMPVWRQRQYSSDSP